MTRRFADSAGARIAWEDSGQPRAPTVVLLHSLGCDAQMWAPQVLALKDRYHLMAVDMRGHGHADAPPGPYAIEELALDVIAVADAAEVDRFHVCGLSIGGQLAQWLGVHRPERLYSLVLANTAARIGTTESWQQRIEAVRQGGMAAIADGVVENWFSEETRAADPQRFVTARERLLTTSPDGYTGCCAALSTSDLRALVDTISVPTLVIGGEADIPTPPSQAVALHEAIPGSELTIIEGAAHISNLDKADAFTAQLDGFVARHQ